MAVGILGTASCALAICALILHASGVRPFGPRSGILGDEGAQYIHFYAVFRDVITGSDLSSLQFSWALGAGVPFLATYATYLGGPFTFLVALFPAHRIATALAAIVILKIAVAAAVMFLLLRTLGRRRHPLIAGVLAVAYATSAWVIEVGWRSPQWMDGLIAFPALCLVALRCRYRRRRLWPGVLVVALFWWSNYYTAYMASLGSAIVLVAIELSVSHNLRTSAARIGRFALTGALGVALTAPTLIPALVAMHNGVPYPGAPIVGLEWSSILVRTFPLTAGVALTPALFCSSAALLLVLGLPCASHLSRRLRLVLVGIGAVVVVSLRIPALLVAWSAFAVPHGGPFRFAFIICGLIVITAHTAWPPRHTGRPAPASVAGALLAPHGWPGLPACVCAAVLLSLLSRSMVYPRDTLLVVAPGAAGLSWALLGIAAAASLALAVAAARNTPRILTCVVLIVAIAAGIILTLHENLATAAHINDNVRGWSKELDVKASTDRYRNRRAAALTNEAGWPAHRVNAHLTDSDPMWARYNASGRYSYPGLGYYSTTVEAGTADALMELGYRKVSGGRTLYRPDDEVLSALLAAQDSRSRFDPMPMVRRVSDIRTGPGQPPDLAARERLLGAHIYSTPPVHRRTATGLSLVPGSSMVPRGGHTDLQITCPAGQYVITHTYARGSARVVLPSGRTTSGIARAEETQGQAMVGSHFLVRRSDGTPTTVRISANDRYFPGDVPLGADPLACLDPARLEHAVAATRIPAELSVSPSHVEARLTASASPGADHVVVATPAVKGWRCRVGGHRVPISPLSGMLAVRTPEAGMLTCSYRPPGLVAGIAVGVAALLTTALITITQRPRRAGEDEES